MATSKAWRDTHYPRSSQQVSWCYDMLQFYYEMLQCMKPFQRERQVPFTCEVKVKKQYKYTCNSVKRDYRKRLHICLYMYIQITKIHTEHALYLLQLKKE